MTVKFPVRLSIQINTIHSIIWSRVGVLKKPLQDEDNYKRLRIYRYGISGGVVRNKEITGKLIK